MSSIRRARMLPGAALAAALVLASTSGAAIAAWSAASSGSATGLAAVVPTGPTPSVSSTSLTILLARHTVSFAPVVVGAPDGVQVTSYRVERRVSGTWVRTPQGSGTCAADIPAQNPAPTRYSCTHDETVTLGAPPYRVIAIYEQWQGPPGNPSS